MTTYRHASGLPEGYRHDDDGALAAVKGSTIYDAAPIRRAILDGTRINLSYCTIAGLDLDGCDLRNLTAIQTRFAGVSLSGATLDGAVCNNARFDQCSARGSSWINASLSGASLGGCDLREARLDGIGFVRGNANRANLRGANLSRSKLGFAQLSAVDAIGADFAGAQMPYTKLRFSVCSFANFDGAKVIQADATGARLDHVSLRGSLWEQVRLDAIESSGTNFGDAATPPVQGEIARPWVDTTLWGTRAQAMAVPDPFADQDWRNALLERDLGTPFRDLLEPRRLGRAR